VSGSALIVDYMLTLASSVASGVDAVFNPLPAVALPHPLVRELARVVVLCFLHLRCRQESNKVLLPVFLDFFWHACRLDCDRDRHASV
jgi:hypothetical protein